MEPSLHPLSVEGIFQSADDETPLLRLRDDRGRLLEFPIGLCEGLAIQMALDNQYPERPFTHDLLVTIASHLDAHITRVIIDDFSNGTYYARLILTTKDGPLNLDCRPSDAVAIALRVKVPIFANDAAIDQVR